MFRVDIFDNDFKITDSSIVKEQELLQTSAIFLFSAGLVANFLSGAPWEVGTIKTFSDWAVSSSAMHLGNLGSDGTSSILKGLNSAWIFRTLWGTCMLLTLLAIIACYVARSTLLGVWYWTKQGLVQLKQTV
jgi:hypothetical protein